MICGMTYYQICWYFLIYSFAGWIVEVIFHAVTFGKVINRGFLNGPVCPIYGFGVLSVFATVNQFQTVGKTLNGIELFLFGMLLATTVELLAGWLLDKCFHARWWDYSDKPMNYHGYICMEFSLIWGLAIVMVVRIFQKYIEHTSERTFENQYGWLVLFICYLIYLVDIIVTIAIIKGLNKKLKRLDQLRSDLRIASDHISDYVANRSIETAQVIGEGKVQMALAKAELKDAAIIQLKEKKESLQKEYDDLTDDLISRQIFGQGRLLRAFPRIQHRKYQDIIQILKERIYKY